MFRIRNGGGMRGSADGERNLGLGCFALRGGRQLGRGGLRPPGARGRGAGSSTSPPGRCLGVQGRAPGTQAGRPRGNQGADSEAIPWLHGGGAPGLTQDEAGVRVRTAAPRCGRPLSTRGPRLPPRHPVRSFPGPSPLLSSRGRRLRALGDSTTGLTQGEDFSPRA